MSSIKCDSLEHRRKPSGHRGWGCSEDKHLGIHPGSGRTGQRNEPGGMSHSQLLTPVCGQWDTWRRGWSRSSGPLHITMSLMFSHVIILNKAPAAAQAQNNLLVLDEKVPNGIIKVWWGSGVAVLQNNCKDWVSLLHRNTHIQRCPHWKGDPAWWVSLSEAGVAKQRHGGSGFGAWAWKATFHPVKKIRLFNYNNQVFFSSISLSCSYCNFLYSSTKVLTFSLWGYMTLWHLQLYDRDK